MATKSTSIADENRHFYQSLLSPTSVRLLELQAGTREDAIKCKLITVGNLDTALGYEALSYCWGSQQERKAVSCNGEIEPFMVTANLFDALIHLRVSNRNRLLWIDAMCINQHDLSERSQQVSIMRSIYANARMVSVWLGVTDTRFAATIEFIKEIAKLCCIHQYGVDEPWSWQKLLSKGADHSWMEFLEEFDPGFIIPDSTAVCWEDLRSFFDLPWFFRVWVIQEVQTCDEVQVLCGEDVVDWRVVTLVAAWLRGSPPAQRRIHDLRNRAGNMGTFMGTTQMYFLNLKRLTTHQEAPFLRLLDRTQSFQSSEPKDKIYALLTYPARRCTFRMQHTNCRGHGMQSSQSQNTVTRHLDIDVDYTLSTVELLCQVTLRSIEQYESLETLNYAWKVRRELFSSRDHLNPDTVLVDSGEYPSWVPQWDAVINNRRPHFRAYLYNACLGLKPVMQRCSMASSIVLQGILVDTVHETNVTLRSDASFNSQPVVENSNTSPSEDDMVSISTILVQDHKHHIAGRPQGVDALHERASDNMHEHFANFAEYISRTLEGRTRSVFVSLNNITCHVCFRTIMDIHHAYEEVQTAQNCRLCHMGAFDICPECYSADQQCLSTSHTIQPRNLQGFWYQYRSEETEKLAKARANGVAREFAVAAGAAFDRRSAFRTAKGLVGICPLVAVPSDIVVILFGGRTPYILRKIGDHYRLVCDCYLHGMRDGEAVRMWQEGVLDTQDFELR